MINGDDFLALLVLFGLGYIFYKKFVEGSDILDKLQDGTRKAFHKDKRMFGRFKP